MRSSASRCNRSCSIYPNISVFIDFAELHILYKNVFQCSNKKNINNICYNVMECMPIILKLIKLDLIFMLLIFACNCIKTFTQSICINVGNCGSSLNATIDLDEKFCPRRQVVISKFDFVQPDCTFLNYVLVPTKTKIQ